MEQERVVVTGLGTVNADCLQRARVFPAGCRAGSCGIGPVTVFDTADFRTHAGGEVRGFDARAR